jgi:hypothetical protein
MSRRRRRSKKPPTPAKPHPDYAVLPQHIPLEDTITSQPAEPPQDPYGGRDTETEFMIRHAGF